MLQDGLSSATGTRPEIGRAVSAGLWPAPARSFAPAMLLFLPIAAAWLGSRLAGTGWRSRSSLAGLLPIVPWTIRNIRVYDRFVLIASEGGVTFWTGNHPLAVGDGDLAANPGSSEAEIEFRRAHRRPDAEALEPLCYRDALAYITAHPVWWMSLLARKAFYLAVPIGPSYALHSTRYRAASAVPYLLLLPFAIAGARRLVRAADRPRLCSCWPAPPC